MKGPKPVPLRTRLILTGAQQFVSSIDGGALGAAMANNPGAGKTPINFI